MLRELTQKVAVAALSMGVAGAAFADGGYAPSIKDAPYVAPFSWTGFYVGVNAGWHSSTKNLSNTGTDTGPGGLGAVLNAGGIPRSIGLPSNGWIGGAQAGYNYQMGGLVVGAEIDFQWLDSNRSFTTTLQPAGFVPITTAANRELDWLGTARLRLGATIAPQFLVYATGGLAFGEGTTRIAVAIPAAAPPLSASASSDVDLGWTAGGGMEWALNRNWSVKGEYLYYNLGTQSRTLVYNYGANTSTLTTRWKDDGSIARLGINYRF